MNKYQVTFEGHTFKRNSQSRAYTHAVICTKSVELTRKQAEQSARSTWLLNLDYDKELASSDGKIYSTFADGSPCVYDVSPEKIEAAKQRLAAGEEAYVAERLAEHDAREANSPRTRDGRSFVWCQGWCGRIDLAFKLAGSVNKNGIGANIVEAVKV